jgi:hypothetical protein
VKYQLKTSPYSQYENPTGISFIEGNEVIVQVGKTNGSPVVLRVISVKSIDTEPDMKTKKNLS